MEEKPLSSWYAVGIGTLIGVLFIVLIFIIYSLIIIISGGFSSYVKPFNDGGIIYFIIIAITRGSPGIPGGVLGALVGKSRNKTRKATWVGGTIGAILGSATCYAVPILSLLINK